MSDEADYAMIETDRMLAVSLAAHAAKPRLRPKGFCHNPACEDDTDVLFCGIDCRDEYDRLEDAARRLGRSFP